MVEDGGFRNKNTMEIRYFFTSLPILALLCACQTEAPQDNIEPKHVLTVKAMLPGSDDTRSCFAFGSPEYNTRAQITYGNTDPDKEVFIWDEKDWVTAFNITRLSECPKGVELETTSISTDGKIAIFESPDFDPDFKIKAGDLIFVNYYETKRKINDDLSYDDRDIFTIGVGTEENKPQYVVENPDNASLSYMKANLKMYDIVTAVEDDKIPDLHFKHLSAIMRVTLRNETGMYIYPTKLEFKYPETKSFFNTTLYCSVDTTLSCGLKVYTENEFFNGTDPYTDNIGTTINGKNNTTDIGDSIAPGKTYDLYISTVPRIDNEATGNSLTIDLIKRHNTNHPYTITLDGFNVPIKAGKRYWFNLTAVSTITETDTINKLVLTSDWLKAHPDANP